MAKAPLFTICMQGFYKISKEQCVTICAAVFQGVVESSTVFFRGAKEEFAFIVFSCAELALGYDFSPSVVICLIARPAVVRNSAPKSKSSALDVEPEI